MRAIRAHWPNTEILLRADSHYCGRPRFSIGVAPMASITSSASRQPRHCAAMSKVSKPARRRGFEGRAADDSFVVSWSSSTARAKLEPGRAHHRPRRSRRASTGHPLRRHQSEQTATLAGSTRMSISPSAARPKTISSPGRPIWRRIARPAPGRQPTSFGCSCMRARTG